MRSNGKKNSVSPRAAYNSNVNRFLPVNIATLNKCNGIIGDEKYWSYPFRHAIVDLVEHICLNYATYKQNVPASRGSIYGARWHRAQPEGSDLSRPLA